MRLKQTLFIKCQDVLNSRLKVIKESILDIQNSLFSETKSSAGDKHETGRAMLQLEREKVGQQLAEIQTQFKILNRIVPDNQQRTVALGSIVFTFQSNYFVSISIGELLIDNQKFYAISMASPIARLLIGKTVGDNFNFRDQEIIITKII